MGGTDRISLKGADGAQAVFVMPARGTLLERAKPGTLDHFLLERYTAYTHRGRTRWFSVDHDPWDYHPLDWIRADTALIEESFPWFRRGELVAAHASPGVRDVRMSLPHSLKADARDDLVPRHAAATAG